MNKPFHIHIPILIRKISYKHKPTGIPSLSKTLHTDLHFTIRMVKGQWKYQNLHINLPSTLIYSKTHTVCRYLDFFLTDGYTHWFNNEFPSLPNISTDIFNINVLIYLIIIREINISEHKVMASSLSTAINQQLVTVHKRSFQINCGF